MSLEHDPLGDGVRMFRAATAAPADGAATRARVLEEAERRIVRRARFHRAAVGAATLLAVLSFGSVAWTALGHWRASRAAARAVPAAQPAPARAVSPPALAPAPPPETPPAVEPGLPAAKAAPAVRAPDPGLEATLYARAHDAHFTRDAPRAALAAWNHYLQVFPSGAFVPDARYNRALCLLRLERLDDAARALRPFASGAYHGYRRVEAQALLDWIEQQRPSAP